MKRYSEERKQSIIKRMIPPDNTPISKLVEETGISDCTLYKRVLMHQRCSGLGFEICALV